MATRPVVPRATGEGSIGTDAKHWGAGYFDNLSLVGEDVAGTLSNMDLALAESTGYGIVSGCEPTISGLTVTVSSGVVHLADGTRKELSATNITLDTADSANPRIDLVYIDSTGTVAKITGTAAASPVVPTLPTGGISVAQVSVAAGATTGIIELAKKNIPNLYYKKDIYQESILTPFLSYHQAGVEWEEQKSIDAAGNTLTVATMNVLGWVNGQVGRGFLSNFTLSKQLTVALMTKAQVIGYNEMFYNVNYDTPSLYAIDGKFIDNNFGADYDGNWKNGYSYGNLLESAFAVTDKAAGSYTQEAGREVCGWVKIVLNKNGKTISLYSTHFDPSWTYVPPQITEFYNIISADNSQYKIVMGDFNTEDLTMFSQFTSAGFNFVNTGQYKTYKNTGAIDNIMISSDISIIDSGMINVVDAPNDFPQIFGYAVSDHNPLWARLQLN